MNIYVNIDMEKTGKRLERVIRAAGFSVKTIQNYLHLSCPQPIYRWFKGQILPSVDHLYVLSGLLGMHMEELIVPKQYSRQIVLMQTRDRAFAWDECRSNDECRLLAYYQSICRMAA